MTNGLKSHLALPPPESSGGVKPSEQGLKVGSVRDKAVSGYGVADIIGGEDRRMIGETGKAPWHLICSLVGWFGGRPHILGTGALVAPRLVLTAGHCVIRRLDKIDVIPGRNGGNEPFGRREVKPSGYRTHPDWAQHQHKDRDAGALVLDRPFEDIGGWMAVAAPPPEAAVGWQVNIAGYPKESPAGTGNGGDELWFHSNGVEDASARKLTYAIDTTVGQSGSPVWIHDGDDDPPTVIGIHAYGVKNDLVHLPGATNSATRIDDDLAAHIRRWAEA